eukprot:m.144045 g.144045  ORF g.144045 m.144045 type:complete len:411 (-) comp16186_c0_seq1:1273-2505(-)
MAASHLTWCAKEHSPLLETFVGDKVQYGGTASGQPEPAAIRTSSPVPTNCGVYYFELTAIQIDQPGGRVACGFTNIKSPSYSTLPGTSENSWAYRVDTGEAWHDRSVAFTGPAFNDGHVLGCGFDLFRHVIFFTKDGVLLDGTFAYQPIGDDGEKYDWWPILGMASRGAVVKANFGSSPFVYDIAAYKATVQLEVEKQIRSQELSPALIEALPKLALNYLIHRGYSKTAAVFAKQPVSQASQANARREVMTAITKGDCDEALKQAHQLCPTMAQDHPEALFQLHCQRYVELIRTSHGDDTLIDQLISEGQALQLLSDDLLKHAMFDVTCMHDIFLLAAHPDLASCPMLTYLDEQRRHDVADIVNSALLEHFDARSQSHLEVMLRHIQQCLKALQDQGDGAAAFVDIANFL